MSNFKERESLHFLMGEWNRSRRVCGTNNILEVMEWMGGNTTLSSKRSGFQGGSGSLQVSVAGGGGRWWLQLFQSIYEKSKRNLRSSG